MSVSYRTLCGVICFFIAGVGVSESAIPRSEVVIIQDFSGSLDVQSFAEARTNLAAELPALLEELNARRLEVRSFDTDGWQSRRLLERQLPELKLPADEAPQENEALQFENIREADEKERQHRRTLKLDEAKKQYASQMAQQLRGVVPLPAPPEGYQAASSDVMGMFKYVTTFTANTPTYIIVITDLLDSQYKELPVQTSAAPNVKLLIIFVPGTPAEVKRSMGRAFTGSQQFEAQLKQVRQSAPWALMVPHTARGYRELFKQHAAARKRP